MDIDYHPTASAAVSDSEHPAIQELQGAYVLHVREWILYERALSRSQTYRANKAAGPRFGYCLTPLEFERIRADLDRSCESFLSSLRAYVTAFEAVPAEEMRSFKGPDPLTYLDMLLDVFPEGPTVDEALGWLRSFPSGPDPKDMLEHALAVDRYALKGVFLVRRRHRSRPQTDT